MGLVQARDYAEAVRQATMLLDGRSDDLTTELTTAMESASERLDFEEAARLRDLVASIHQLQSRQYDEHNACRPVSASPAAQIFTYGSLFEQADFSSS